LIGEPPVARHPDLETGSRLEMPLLPLGAAGAHDLADGVREITLYLWVILKRLSWGRQGPDCGRLLL
jgi:hypothetical protein